MKTTAVILISAALVLLVSSGIAAQDKYIPKPNEELYGTWTNEKNRGDLFHPQKVVVTQDGYTGYSKISDSDSLFSWKLSIDSKWTDSDGNIWYKILGIGDGSWKGYKSQKLYKLSKSGTVMERAWTDVGNGAYDASMYPKKIDPMISSYRILYRLGN
jgi:hypothetical protein